MLQCLSYYFLLFARRRRKGSSPGIDRKLGVHFCISVSHDDNSNTIFLCWVVPKSVSYDSKADDGFERALGNFRIHQYIEHSR